MFRPMRRFRQEMTREACEEILRTAPSGVLSLLDEAGYPANADGKRDLNLTISVTATRSTDEVVMMQNDWDKIGVTVTIDQKEYATLLQEYIDGTYQIGSRGWTADYPIMYNFLQPLFYTGVGDNVSHYSNAEFDAKLDEACQTVDDDKRVALMQEANKIAAEDMPIFPMLHKSLNKVTSGNFEVMVDAARNPELHMATKTA